MKLNSLNSAQLKEREDATVFTGFIFWWTNRGYMHLGLQILVATYVPEIFLNTFYYIPSGSKLDVS